MKKIFRNNIGLRLGGAFALLLLMMTLITTIGITQVMRLGQNIKTLVDERYPHTTLANTIRSDFSEVLAAINGIDADFSAEQIKGGARGH